MPERPARPSPGQQLAEEVLGQPIKPWIAERRLAGATWQAIAGELRAVTDGKVDFSHVTVRSWSDEPVVPKGAEATA